MRWLGWLLVAVLAVAGVGAACGGGAPEREVGSQRPAEQEAISQDDAADDLADALEANDDRGAAQGGTEVEARMIAVPLTRETADAAQQAAAETRSSNAAATAGLGVVVQTSNDPIRINVFPMEDSLTAQGPAALGLSPLLLPLQLSAGPWNCAVGLDHPVPDEAEGRFVVTFADFNEAGSEVAVEASGPEWSGEARLDVVGIAGSLTGRALTATIVSDLQDGMWTINCRLVEE